jgi:hypothetical protein
LELGAAPDEKPMSAVAASFGPSAIDAHNLKRGDLTAGMDHGAHLIHRKRLGRRRTYAALDDPSQAGTPLKANPPKSCRRPDFGRVPNASCSPGCHMVVLETYAATGLWSKLQVCNFGQRHPTPMKTVRRCRSDDLGTAHR